MMSAKSYRLVWFQHFHKAGGTSVVRLAESNGEVLYPRNANGNPCRPDGELIRVWDFDERQLTRFIDSCEKRGVTFVSTEWGLPLLDVLRRDARVTTVTCIRDPLKRLVSNFYFDLYHGETTARRVEDYPDSYTGDGGAYTMANYYCRVLTRQDNSPREIDRALYSKAKEAVYGFDCWTLLEHGLVGLGRALGWSREEVHQRRTEYGLGKAVKFLARGKLNLLWYRFTRPKVEPASDFVERFVRDNQWDIRLYNELETSELMAS